MTVKIFGITGWKNSGKTTLTERLVRELTSRGYRISTVKHTHHDFDIDHEGTDSWRHRKAGAFETAIISDNRFAIMHENAPDESVSLGEIIARLAPADLVLVEGFKTETHKKIELRRIGGRDGPAIADNDESVVAIAADHHLEGQILPVFDLNSIAEIADFIEVTMGLDKPASRL